MLNCTQGELSLWIGPSRDVAPVRYAFETGDSGQSVTAAEVLMMDPSAAVHSLLGFCYARSYALSPASQDGRTPVRCWVVPIWFLVLFACAWPSRMVVRHVQREQARAAAAACQCRRCGAALAADETRCHACSFPALVRRGVVA